MDKDEVIKTAKEAGGSYTGKHDLHQMTTSELQCFLKLAMERERKNENEVRGKIIDACEG